MANDVESMSTSTQDATFSLPRKWNPTVGSGSTMEVKIKSYDEVINFEIW